MNIELSYNFENEDLLSFVSILGLFGLHIFFFF